MKGPIHAKCCSMTSHWRQKKRPHHACTKTVALAASLPTSRVQDRLPHVPMYLAVDIQLIRERRRLSLHSTSDRTYFVPCTPNTFSNRSLLSLDLVHGTVCLQTSDWRHNSVHSSRNSKQHCLRSRDHGALRLFVSAVLYKYSCLVTYLRKF